MAPLPNTSFVPTQAEIALVNQILALADTQKLNLVTGDAAVKVFAGAKLSPVVLGEIWALADKENNGFLTRSGLATSVRLIGHAQQGESVSEDLLDRRTSCCQAFAIVYLLMSFSPSYVLREYQPLLGWRISKESRGQHHKRLQSRLAKVLDLPLHAVLNYHPSHQRTSPSSCEFLFLVDRLMVFSLVRLQLICKLV